MNTDEREAATTAGRIKVWDPFVRIFHWTVVAAFFLAYFTEDDLLTLHVWAGYTLGALVVLRIPWGFIGPRHARFSDFLCMPRTAWRYALDLLGFRAKRHIGHSPAGGVMVIMLLIASAVTVWSGLELYADEQNAGPLASSAWVSAARASEHRPDEDEGEKRKDERNDEDSVWEEIHEVLADLMLVFVLLHVGGVVLASVVHRENLVWSMITGYKRRE